MPFLLSRPAKAARDTATAPEAAVPGSRRVVVCVQGPAAGRLPRVRPLSAPLQSNGVGAVTVCPRGTNKKPLFLRVNRTLLMMPANLSYTLAVDFEWVHVTSTVAFLCVFA